MGPHVSVMDLPRVKRKRKLKFSDDEIDLLVHEVTANLNILQDRTSTTSEKNCLCLRLARITAAIEKGKFVQTGKRASCFRPAFKIQRISPALTGSLYKQNIPQNI